MISRRWASVGHRRARPSYIVCPTSSSTATAIVASQAIWRTTSMLMNPSRSSSPASVDASSVSASNGTWATTK